MSNPYYSVAGVPATSAALSSATIRAEFAAIAAGFDKLPTLTANSLKLIGVNAGETALVPVATTGTGSAVLATSPTLVTPALGIASATTINKVALTAPATGSTLTIADGKTLTANNSLTLAGTDGTTHTLPTTSATIARTDAGQTFTGNQVITGSLSVSGRTLLNGATDDGVNALQIAGAVVADSAGTGTLGTAGVYWDACFLGASGLSTDALKARLTAITVTGQLDLTTGASMKLGGGGGTGLVSVGAADSAGAGFRTVRIPN